MDAELNAAREGLYRWLGRCLVQVQGIEMRLKQLLASRSFGGTVEEIEEQLATRHLDYATNTLGTLVKLVTTDFLLAEGQESALISDEPDVTAPTLRVRYSITMDPERLAAMRQELAELVTWRNDTVHHLATLYPLNTAQGCRQAQEYLENFSGKLDNHRQEIESWVSGFVDAHAYQVQLMNSPEYRDMLFDGIFPDGSVQWDVSGIVRALSNAASTRAKGVWMPLDEAIAWIRREAPTQIPSRYKCSTYRQVIHESRAFEVRREPGADGRMVLFYRAKA